ncbi:ABC transporter family protein [Histomonas meleagridis]|uniref:ABC transporter family protein n=1 Tax=Histomonas meleagridis TaxID=135588 RepID=UPI00355A9852|nr:ABC transporter family protein [Histomonas meleagridis]KAH0799357.1 ABC transporter family protein [Histomonas meleagridis]
MPPMQRVFATQGSNDGDYELKGGEFGKCIGLMKHKVLFVISIILSVLHGASPLLMNVVMGDMMNSMTTVTGDAGIDLDFITNLCIEMIVIIAIMTVIQILSMTARIIAGTAYFADLRLRMFENLVKQDIPYFDKVPTGVLVGRIAEDVVLIRETYVDKFSQVIQSAAQSIAGIILAFCTVWRVTLVCCVVIPLCAITFIVGSKCIDKLWIEYNDSSTACSTKAEEVITQIRTVKSFDCELHEFELYSQSLDSVYGVYKKTSLAHGIKDGLITLFVWLMIAVLIYYVSWMIVAEPYLGVQPGDIMILMMSMMLGTMGVSTALSSIDDFDKARISASKILDIVTRKPQVDNDEGADSIHGNKTIEGTIEFRDVSFKYESNDQYAVQHLSFKVNAGENVALVGESGCGKSTTLQLLQRFYEVESGEILIDGVNITELSPHFLRSQIAVVPQGPVLYSMSIEDNIKFARPDATNEEMQKAAKLGNAHSFIMEQPHNYHQTVQQTSLSGGQKQRICISRAILMDAPILLLDEATAALDTESEQLVQQSLEKIRHGKTAIMVAHRLATVINSDRIFVFKDGRVIETGTHKELLAKNGIYADLVKYQLQ